MIKDQTHQKIKILIIDDSSDSRKMIQHLLRKKNYTNLHFAEDGEAGLELIYHHYNHNKPFDIILCDWLMPKLLGIDLLKKIRSSHNFKTLPFIMISATQEMEQIKEAAVNDVTNYIVKPINAEKLYAKVKQAILIKQIHEDKKQLKLETK